MKYSLQNIVPLLSLAAVVLLPIESPACGPSFQPSYIKNKSPYMTVLHRELAVKRLIADLEDLIPVVPEIPDGVSWETAVKQDFTEAVNRYLPQLAPEEKQKLIDEYLIFVQDARKSKDPSMENFPDLPEELAEFRLYRAGVAEMEPDGKDIPPSWKKLLELPPGSRHYRTVWVYYMLGNYLTHDCTRYYQACRAAAREGFADTHGLLKASYKSEFRYSPDPVRRIHAALEAQRNRPDMKLLAREYRITRVPHYDSWADSNTLVPQSDAECVAMLEDPLCREVLAIFGCDRKIFRLKVWKYKFRNADVMAWRAYEAGDVETAEKYLGLRTRDTLLSTYIEAKIARYHGDSELAIRKLRQWLKFVEEIDPNDRPDIVEMKYDSDPFDFEPSYPLKEDVYGQLGSALVHRRDFTEAMMFFYKARQGVDIEYIGERLMTLSELTAFVDTLDEDLKSGLEEEQNYVKWIRHMTARRAFREGKFDIARKYMPSAYKETLDEYLAYIRGAEDLSKSGDDRALCLYNAAKIMRWCGMELCGTQGEPDNFSYEGSYGLNAEIEDCPNCKYDPETDRWTHICTNHQSPYGHYLQDDKTEHDFTPVKGRPPAPRNQRFHYRYRAADLARQAADLAQDEDLRALANLFGGECLRIRTPRKADVFYKRLVKQSPNSEIARIADKLRWFPSCPALKKEMKSLHGSLDQAKALLRTASAELQETMKEKEEQRSPAEMGDVKIIVKSGINEDAPHDEADLAEIWQDGKKVFSLQTHCRAEIVCFETKMIDDRLWLWGLNEFLENGVDFRKYLVDLKGDGDKRYLILVDWYGGNSVFGYTGYLLDAKDHFKCLGKVPVGEGCVYPAKNPDLEFSYHQEVEYFGAGGSAILTVTMRLENGKAVPVTIKRRETFDLAPYARELKLKRCKNEYEHEFWRMIFIQLYADLASAGLLKKGPEFARQLGYDPDEIRKYHEESLKLIHECKFWQYLKEVNE